MTIICFDQLNFATRKKCLMIPKGQSEAVNGRETDKTMTKRKNENMANKDIQHTSQKTKDLAKQTPKQSEVTSGAPRRLAVPILLETFVVLLSNEKKTFKFKTALFI